MAGKLGVLRALQTYAADFSYPFLEKQGRGRSGFRGEQVGKIMAMEVKSADLDQPRLSRSDRSFIDAYSPEKFVILNRSLETTLAIDNCRIDFQTPYNYGDIHG